ncbi:MAG: alpha-amylase family glycosyl hydrolase [Brevinematales bacterium]|nr:alpha-amylase family glycosyl hydrolase [Brevinematales bacterium]
MKSLLKVTLLALVVLLAFVGVSSANKTLIVYVYTNSNLASWPSIQLYYWFPNTTTSGFVNRISNYQQWYVFVITNIPNLTNRIGLKLRSDANWTRQEPIKNGYDRIVSLPSIYSVSNTAHIYVHSPVNWWETYAWWLPNEISLYENPTASAVTNYFGATYSGGTYYTTHFSFYAPNARKVYVAGDFNSWNPTNTPMRLSRNREIWWAAVNNTSPGQQYKFVVERHDRTLVWVSDPAARKQVHSTGNSVIVSQAYTWATWTRPTHDYYNIYQIHIRTFFTNGSDYSGWGTFNTAINMFNYITNLGITAVEPLPIQEFAGDLSWGYNYVFHYAPETSYAGGGTSSAGTNIISLKNFVNEAHKRGLAVILDLVFNHQGASDDPIAIFDPAADWNNPDTYWYSGSTPWGPRFNYSNPMVRKFLVDSARYFMEFFRVDGFRFDATAYINNWDFMQFVTDSLRAIDSRVLLIAEHLPNDAWVTRKKAAGGAGFDSQWNVNLSHELKKLFTSGPSTVDINSIANYIVADYLNNGLDNQSPNGLFAIQYHVSHDEAANGKQRPSADLVNRGSWGNSEYDAQGQMITAVATAVMARGIPMLFFGEEFLEGYWPNNQKWFRDDVPITWANLNNIRATNTMRAVRDLNWIRRNNAAVRFDQIGVLHINNTDKVIAFRRGYGTGSGDIYVIINYNKQSYSSYGIPFPSAGTWNLIFAHPSGAYGDPWADVYLTNPVNYSGSGNVNIKIPEYGVLIYRKQ